MNSHENTRVVASADTHASANEAPAYWSGVFAMTLCVFALVASEFMPVSLLTPIAQTLSVTEGMAGQGIAISGVFAVITSLFITSITHGINRKALLLILTVMMGLSGAIVGMATHYVTYLIGRALIGAVIGGFWSMSAAIAMRLVPEKQVSTALAVFNSGNALAIVIAAPLGAYLGAVIGWRGAFLCLVPISLLALLWLSISLPSLPDDKPDNKRNAFATFTLLRSPVVIIGMLSVGVFFMGQFSLYTYVRPFLERVTLVDVNSLSFILLLIGIAGLVGTLLVNIPLQRGFYHTLVAIPLFMAVIAIALTQVGHCVIAVAIVLSIWGLVATAAPVGWWAWIAKTFPNDAEAGGGLMVAVVQLSIALGSIIGGVFFDTYGYQLTFFISALLLIAAACLTFWTSKLTKRAMS